MRPFVIIRQRWRALLLPLLALATFGADNGDPATPLKLAFLAGFLVLIAPRLAVRLGPYALVAYAIFGFLQGNGYVGVPWDSGIGPEWYGGIRLNGDAGLLIPLSLAFGAAGVWLIVRANGREARWLRARYAELRGPGPVPGWLLVPVFALWVMLVHPGEYSAHAGALLLILGVCVVTMLLSRRVAAIAAVFGLSVYAAYGVLMSIVPSGLPAALYGVVAQQHGAAFAGLQGVVLLTMVVALRLWPRLVSDSPERLLAERASWLSQRVQRLTQTRSDATDAAVAELRRIERDLHDGAQARLVALGMSLRAAETLMETDPAAALALVSEARATSSRALSDLRDLVRGIYPPVLADRGLADALRSLALDAPLRAEVDATVPDDIPMPLAAAVYFAAAEALANAVRHADARRVQIHAHLTAGMLRVEVIDDGRGGADVSAGSGLSGIERRLATFDGILAVSSPVGGPTIVAIEVPCALSSVKISTS